MREIESKNNRLLVEARKVRDGKTPGLFFVEGMRLIRELATSGHTVAHLFVDVERSEEHVTLSNKFPADRSYSCSAQLMRSVSDTKNPQGIVAIVKEPAHAFIDLKQFLKERGPTRLLVLQGISNPGNLGTIVRTAEAGNFDGVVVAGNSTSPFGAAAVRGSMGSIFRLPVFAHKDTAELLGCLKEAEFGLVGSNANADTSVFKYSWPEKTAIVLGNEAHGLEDETLALLDQAVSIPMNRNVESLNLSVSAAILIYALQTN